MGSLALREEVPCGRVGHAGASGALEHHQALPLIEVGGERGEVELGEEGALQGGVDAVHGAELPLLNLVVQQPAVARRLHRPSPKPCRSLSLQCGAIRLSVASSYHRFEAGLRKSADGGKGARRSCASAFCVCPGRLGSDADSQRKTIKQP